MHKKSSRLKGNEKETWGEKHPPQFLPLIFFSVCLPRSAFITFPLLTATLFFILTLNRLVMGDSINTYYPHGFY